MLALDDWKGAVVGRTDPTGLPFVRQCQQPSVNGVSGSFLALGSDGNQWWVKAPHDPELGMAVVTEYIVGRAGALIAAPTCATTLIEITADVSGWEYRPGRSLQAGIGHATAHVPGAIEERPLLRHRGDDDNRRRHAGVFAIFDWCYGGDQQWLHSTTDQLTLYSHDHGWYFPPLGPTWSVSSLQAAVDLPWQLRDNILGLSVAALREYADNLRRVSAASLMQVMQSVPASWPVQDAELEAAAWFLLRRAEPVADRLEAIAVALSSGGSP